MASCAPACKTKDIAEYLPVVESFKDPVTATRDDRDVLVAMTPEAYDNLKCDLAHERLMRRLDRAEL